MLQEHFKSPRKKETKGCCLMGFEAMCPLRPSPMFYLSICSFWKGKQESTLYEGQPNSFALSLEVLNSWNHSDQSFTAEEIVKLGHLCQFLKMKAAKALCPQVKAHLHTLLPGTKAAALHHDNITPKASHLSMYSIHPHLPRTWTHDRG